MMFSCNTVSSFVYICIVVGTLYISVFTAYTYNTFHLQSMYTVRYMYCAVPTNRILHVHSIVQLDSVLFVMYSAFM